MSDPNTPSPELEARLDALQAQLGYRFTDPALLLQAVTHASYANEDGGAMDNQRLEFLGDSVLGLIISTRLFERFTDSTEGSLSRLRSRLVCEETLALQAQRLGLGECLRLGRGERGSGGQQKASVLSDAYEALLAAIYLDGGYAAAQAVTLAAFEGEMAEVAQPERGKDFKTQLQELIQADSDIRPRYVIIDVAGPPHARFFTAEVRVGEQVLGVGSGSNKKTAQQNAAQVALETLAAGPLAP